MSTKAKWARGFLVAEVVLAGLTLSYAVFVLDRAPSALSPEQYAAWAEGIFGMDAKTSP